MKFSMRELHIISFEEAIKTKYNLAVRDLLLLIFKENAKEQTKGMRLMFVIFL